MKTAVKERRHQLKFFEIALLIGLAVFLTSGALALRTQNDLAEKVVRLHVLANSDSEEDQALKLKVRDVVLERATAILEDSPDRCGGDRCGRLRLPGDGRAGEHGVSHKSV